MNNLNYVTVGVLGSVLALGACSNNPDATQMLNTSSVEYKQEKVEVRLRQFHLGSQHYQLTKSQFIVLALHSHQTCNCLLIWQHSTQSTLLQIVSMVSWMQ